MKKKQLAWVLTMAMTAGMLVPYGAAAEEATEAETTGTEAAAGEVKDPFDYDYVSEDVDADLTIYRYYADTDKVNLDYAINKMQEKYPNLTFTMEHRTDSDGSTLRTWAAVGELPDIFEINSAEVYMLLLAKKVSPVRKQISVPVILFRLYYCSLEAFSASLTSCRCNAASTKPRNSGCGRFGRDLSSGCACVPMKNG